MPKEKLAQPSADTLEVREFIPSSAVDAILPVLRRLFLRSFDDFYKEIKEQLQLKSGKAVLEWLNETFDEMEEEMLKKECRCFLLCESGTMTNEGQRKVLGFLTLKEEGNGSVYIAQCAIDATIKRRGYGAHLLQHLRKVFPSGTSYWGLCRRANTPAVLFYLKQGAKFMDDEQVATKYRYDPKLYTGFRFTDNLQNIPK